MGAASACSARDWNESVFLLWLSRVRSGLPGHFSPSREKWHFAWIFNIKIDSVALLGECFEINNAVCLFSWYVIYENMADRKYNIFQFVEEEGNAFLLWLPLLWRLVWSLLLSSSYATSESTGKVRLSYGIVSDIEGGLQDNQGCKNKNWILISMTAILNRGIIVV